MNALVARPLSASLCLLLLACADSTVRPPDVADGSPEAGPAAEPDGGLSLVAPGDAGTHELLTPIARQCADVPIDLLRPACATDGWCWSHPLPQGNPLLGGFGFTDATGSTTELWAVGTLGMALRLRGGVWESVPTGTTTPLKAIWGSAPDDLWAVGEGGLTLHYDGTSWSRVDSHDDVSLTAVWGTGRRDVWAVGARGHVLHWDGTSWDRSSNPVPIDLQGVWGVANDARVNETRTLWAVGNDGAHVKWDGGRWSIVPPLHPYSSYAIFGTSASNVWTGGQWGMATRYDGVEWSTTPTRSPYAIHAMGGTSPSDIWAAGERGLISHFDGTSWSSDLLGVGETFGSVWACGENSAWFIGATGRVIQWTPDRSYTVRNKAFLQGYLHGGEFADVRSLSGTGPNDVWAAASNGIMHWNGTDWTFTPTTAWGDPYSVWANTPNDVYAGLVDFTVDPATGLPNGRLFHWDGTAWTEVSTPPFNVYDGSDLLLGGTGASDIWLAAMDNEAATWGNFGTVFHYDGVTWTPVVAANPTMFSRVWVPAAGEMWAIEGYGFSVRRFRSGSDETIPTPGRFYDLWSMPSSSVLDLWAVGDAGAIARWNGTEWKLEPKVTDRTLRAVWGSSPNDVWAAGDGVVVHYDGTAWSASYTVTTNRLGGRTSGGLWGSSSKDVWVIGERGTILRRHVP